MVNMETHFYEPTDAAREMRQSMKRKLNSTLDHYQANTSDDRDAVNRLKQNMKLDFNSGGSKKPKMSILQSPDLNMLKLASPELEKMIIANGMVTTTPTPTQFIFPKYVTEEQEAYARGFIDALAELHSDLPTKQEDMDDDADDDDDDDDEDDDEEESKVIIGSGSPTSLTSIRRSLNSTTATTSVPGGLSALALSRPLNIKTLNTELILSRLKEEPSQIVPCIENTPPLSPINMENQEVIKLERKRARNRVAARKCRTRKLERISRLEDKVKDLKGQNSDLVTTATTLRDQVCKLKKQIIDHVNSGCQIMMTHNISFQL